MEWNRRGGPTINLCTLSVQFVTIVYSRPPSTISKTDFILISARKRLAVSVSEKMRNYYLRARDVGDACSFLRLCLRWKPAASCVPVSENFLGDANNQLYRMLE